MPKLIPSSNIHVKNGDSCKYKIASKPIELFCNLPLKYTSPHTKQVKDGKKFITVSFGWAFVCPKGHRLSDGY